MSTDRIIVCKYLCYVYHRMFEDCLRTGASDSKNEDAAGDERELHNCNLYSSTDIVSSVDIETRPQVAPPRNRLHNIYGFWVRVSRKLFRIPLTAPYNLT